MKNPVDRERRREMTVGIFAFAIVFGLLCFSLFLTGGGFWEPQQKVVINFKNVMGLSKGDDVVARGMTVGQVKKLEYHSAEGVVTVICRLNHPLVMRSDYTTTITPTSVLGGSHLDISEGTEKGTILPKGTVLTGGKPNNLIGDASDIASDVKSVMREGHLLVDIQTTVQQVKDIVQKINGGTGTIGRLVNDDSVYADMKSTTENLKEISRRLESGEGFIGKLLSKDEPLYDNTQQLIQDLRSAVDDYRESSPILTFTSVFMGAF